MVPLGSERRVKLSHRAQPTRRKRNSPELGAGPSSSSSSSSSSITLFRRFRSGPRRSGDVVPTACNQHTTSTQHSGEHEHAAYALSELVTVSCLRFDIAAVRFCAMSVRGVMKESVNTHVLPMILSDPPHLRYHDCQL